MKRRSPTGAAARDVIKEELLRFDDAGSDVDLANGHVMGQPVGVAGQAWNGSRGPPQSALLLYPAIPISLPEQLLQ